MGRHRVSNAAFIIFLPLVIQSNALQIDEFLQASAKEGFESTPIESESCHYTEWSPWGYCNRVDCSGVGVRKRDRNVFDDDTSPCLELRDPILEDSEPCDTAPCCSDSTWNREVELGAQRRVGLGGGNQAVIRCIPNPSGKGAAFQFVACVDPTGRRSANGGLWVNAEGFTGFFEQCRIRRPCFYPNTECVRTATVACEDDRGNKVNNGTEWLDSTGQFYKRCELHSVSFADEDGDRWIVKSYVNDVSCVDDWGRKVGNWTEWITKSRKLVFRKLSYATKRQLAFAVQNGSRK